MEQETHDYAEGRIKHVRSAVRSAMAEGEDAEVAIAYLRALAHQQLARGARFSTSTWMSCHPSSRNRSMRCGGWSNTSPW